MGSASPRFRYFLSMFWGPKHFIPERHLTVTPHQLPKPIFPVQVYNTSLPFTPCFFAFSTSFLSWARVVHLFHVHVHLTTHQNLLSTCTCLSHFHPGFSLCLCLSAHGFQTHFLPKNFHVKEPAGVPTQVLRCLFPLAATLCVITRISCRHKSPR